MASIPKIIAKLLYGHRKPQNVIIMESLPAYWDHLPPLLEEFGKRGLTKKYKFYCTTRPDSDVSKIQLPENVFWAPPKTSFLNKLKLYSICAKAIAILDSNEQLPKLNPHSLHLYMTHAAPFKRTRDYYNCTADTDYMLNLSEFLKPISSYQMRIPEEKILTLGFPRNDALFSPIDNLHQCFEGSYDKIIMWYPTYRKHRNNMETGCKNNLPLIHTKENVEKINQAAKEAKVLVVLKLHHAQHLGGINFENFSNLRIITNSFLEERNLHPYQFIAAADAMVTDYSSLFFDWMLLNKPIALVYEDLQEYLTKPGLAVEPLSLNDCADIVYNTDEFVEFIKNVGSGNDPKAASRSANLHKYNQYVDNHSTERVVDFVEEKLAEIHQRF